LNRSAHSPQEAEARKGAGVRRRAGKARLVAALVAASLAGVAAPRVRAAGDEWLPIEPQDLAMKSNPAAPGSHAMILYSETREDAARGATFRYVRIKIFDEEGTKYARAEVRYRLGAYQMEELNARTIHPDGNVVAFTGPTTRRIERRINGSRWVEGFTMPQATPGSIVEYQYQVAFHPGKKHPVKRLVVDRAEFLRLVTEPQYFDWPARGELYIRRERLVIHPAAAELPGQPAVGGTRPGYPQYRTENLPTSTTVTTEKLGTLVCEARDVPAAEEEAYLPSRHDRAGQIEMYYPEHPEESRKEFWGHYSVVEHQWDDEMLDSAKLARKTAEETIEKTDPPEAALGKLYARAQQIRNLSYPTGPEAAGAEEGAPANETVDEVLKHGAGTDADINLTFVAMARAAGFDAKLVRLALRNEEKFDLDRHDVEQLSGTAVWVHVKDKDMVLDPGTPFCPYELLPWPKERTSGFLIQKSSVTAVATGGVTRWESRVSRNAKLEMGRDGWLRGTVEAEFYGQKALELRIEGMDASGRAELVRTEYEKWLPAGTKLEGVSATGWDTEEDPVRAQVQVEVPPEPGKGGGVRAPLTATVAGEANPFESKQRTHAVSLPYPYVEDDEITIRLPEGAEAGPLPADGRARMAMTGEIVSAPENGESTGLRRRQQGEVAVATYQNVRRAEGGRITVKRNLQVSATDIALGDYGKLEQFFHDVHEGDRERVEVSLPASRK